MGWGILEDIGNAVGDIVDAVGDIVDAIGDGAEAVADFVEDTAESAVNIVKDAYEDIADSVQDIIDEAVLLVDDGFPSFGDIVRFGAVLTLSLKNIGDNLLKMVTVPVAIIEHIAHTIGDLAMESIEWIGEKIESGIESVFSILPYGEILQRAYDWVKDSVVKLYDWFTIGAWVITHLGDALTGFLLGGLCKLVGIDEREHGLLRHICDGIENDKIKKGVSHLSSDNRYVIFSDHHLYIEGNSKERFRSNGNLQLYAEVLSKYAYPSSGSPYHLIENGDLEDLWFDEPTLENAIRDEMYDIVGGPVGNVMEETHNDAVHQQRVAEIILSNIEVYGIIRSLYHDSGRYVRLVGNHDLPIKKNFVSMPLREMYPGLEIFDYAIISPSSADPEFRYPDVIVTHGHEYDGWNNKICAEMAGSQITETVSFSADLAAGYHPKSEWKDKLDPNADYSELYSNNLTSLETSFAGFEVPDLGVILGEHKSVDEVKMIKMMREEFDDAPKQPRLVIGHTHEARRTLWNEYVNSGTAGRFEELLWCVEVVGGTPRLYVWLRDKNSGLPFRRKIEHSGTKLRATDDPF